MDVNRDGCELAFIIMFSVFRWQMETFSHKLNTYLESWIGPRGESSLYWHLSSWYKMSLMCLSTKMLSIYILLIYNYTCWGFSPSRGLHFKVYSKHFLVCAAAAVAAASSVTSLIASSWSSSKIWPLYLHISDQRVRGWLLLDNYPPTFALTVMYLLIVWMGPKYMKHRQPYSCRGLMVLYNLGLTLLSLYMFYEVNRLRGTERGVEVGQSNHCNVTDYKRRKRGNRPGPELHSHYMKLSENMARYTCVFNWRFLENVLICFFARVKWEVWYCQLA